jgi:uncharacterized protein YukE
MALDISGAAYGTDASKVNAFLEEIQVDCIDTLIAKLEDTGDLFTKLQENWAGTSEKNFEKNFNNTTEKLIKQIENAGKDLKAEINDVSAAMRKMDDDLIN